MVVKKILKEIIKIIANLDPFCRLIKRHIIKKFKKLNQNESTTKTPWVCEFQYDLDRCVNYIHEVYNDYFSKSNLGFSLISGKKILEVGSGENLGVALKLLANGASEVVCVDRFKSLVEEMKQREIYWKLYELMNDDEKSRINGILKFNNSGFTIDSKKLKYLNMSIEELKAVYSNSYFDMIISRAVLEHISHIDSAMDTMDCLLYQNGFMLHEVDFRDHGMFTNYKLHPLTFLSIDDKTWFDMTCNLGAPNRKLIGYYRDYFKRRGYSTDTVIVKLVDHGDEKYNLKSVPINKSEKIKIEKIIKKVYKQDPLNEVEDLMISAAFFCAQKSSNTKISS